MAATDADRARCAAVQAQLLSALTRGDGFPNGFASDQAANASRALRTKRAHAVADVWPALGAAFGARFDAYARAVAPPATGHGLADGLAFARWLRREELTDAVRVELLCARSALAMSRGRTRPRRGIFAGVIRLRDPARIVVALRIPRDRSRLFTVRLTRST